MTFLENVIRLSSFFEHDPFGKPVPPRIKCGAGFVRIML
jgi:hypothetical protein